MTATNKLAFAATIATPAGGIVTLSADYGTQAHGSTTGNPLDMTDPGPITLTARGDDGGLAVITFNDIDTVATIAAMATSAMRAADSRNRALDKPYPFQETP
jgi:hypothetical protein